MAPLALFVITRSPLAGGLPEFEVAEALVFLERQSETRRGIVWQFHL